MHIARLALYDKRVSREMFHVLAALESAWPGMGTVSVSWAPTDQVARLCDMPESHLLWLTERLEELGYLRCRQFWSDVDQRHVPGFEFLRPTLSKDNHRLGGAHLIPWEWGQHGGQEMPVVRDLRGAVFQQNPDYRPDDPADGFRYGFCCAEATSHE